eukprot:g5995.t1
MGARKIGSAQPSRNFSSEQAASPSLPTDKLLDAVKKHLQDRADDVKKEMQEQTADKGKLEQQLQKLEAPISLATTWDELGFDEFDRVEVLLEVEEAFEVTIPDEEADQIKGVQECMEWLKKNAFCKGGCVRSGGLCSQEESENEQYARACQNEHQLLLQQRKRASSPRRVLPILQRGRGLTTLQEEEEPGDGTKEWDAMEGDGTKAAEEAEVAEVHAELISDNGAPNGAPAEVAEQPLKKRKEEAAASSTLLEFGQHNCCPGSNQEAGSGSGSQPASLGAVQSAGGAAQVSTDPAAPSPGAASPAAGDATAAPASPDTPVDTAPPWRPTAERKALGIQCDDLVKQDGKPTEDGVIGVFLLIGDWGWVPNASCGKPACQGALAERAKKWLQEKKYELKFVISLGDNFYGGVEIEKDKGGKKFEEVWLKKYHELTCVPWYAILGNHDFGEAFHSPCWPYPTRENCYQINGDVREVSETKDCAKSSAGRKNLECWAMPAPSYAVHAWEEELGVTLLGLGLQSFKAQGCKYDGGYPFKAVNPSKKNLFNHQKSLDDSLKVIEEAKKKSLAENVLVFNHYPLHWHGHGCTAKDCQKLTAYFFEDPLKKIAGSGKKVHYWAGHVHNTDDPNLH